jgi:hypothetical protein
MSEGRPTEQAKASFGFASVQANFGITAADREVYPNEYKQRIAMSVKAIAEGLENLAIGLRATYILLEKIEQKQRTGR